MVVPSDDVPADHAGLVFATRKDKVGALDTAQLHAGWADKLARTLGVRLASVAPSVWHADAGRADSPPRDVNAPGAVPDELVLSRAAQQAVALAQREKSTWTRRSAAGRPLTAPVIASATAAGA